MKWKLTNAAKVIAILLLALVALHPLLQPTLPWSADGQLHFWRVVELDHCLRNGYFYPRWMPDMAYGYGYPLLNYYAPLSVYLAEGFHLLGFDFTAALLAALSASLLLGALGVYFWAKEVFGEAGGIIAAVVYTYAPYTLYDAIWRGILAESLALGLLPWAFWRLRRLALHPSGRNLALAALAFALLVLSHNITALIAAPLLAGYALLLWLTTERSRKTLRLLIGALALGLALSAFFWLPAILEQDLVQTEKLLASYFDFRHNFLSLSELLSPPLPADVTWMNPPVPRSLGWPALALAMLGLAGSWKFVKLDGRNQPINLSTYQPTRFRWEILGVFATLILCAFLTLPVSAFLWDSVPLLPYTEFPWRLLGPASLMAAWLAGAAMHWLLRLPLQLGVRVLAATLATLAVVVFSLPWLYPRYLEPIENPTPAGLIAFERQSGALGTTSASEFLPPWVEELPDPTALEALYQAGGAIQRLPRESLLEGATIVSETWRLIGGDVTVNSPRDWTATLHLFHFPGWRVWLNGAPVEVTPSSPHGLVSFAVPAGETHIRVRFGFTPWRRAGTILSAVGLVALALLSVRRAPSRLTAASEVITGGAHLVWLSALTAVGLVLVAKAAYLDTHDSPVRYVGFDGQQVAGISVPVQIQLEDGVRLLGYDPATLAVQSGDTLSVALYWTADAPLDGEYGSFLHLVDAAGHRWGQSDNQHPGGYPTLRWRPGEYNRDTHALAVVPGTPPGNYSLLAGLVGHTPVTIGQVAVARPQHPPSIETLDMAHRLDAHLGDLTLLGLRLGRSEAAPGDTLHLTLFWRAERAPSQDYVGSLQMLDIDGRIVTETTLPPATASYPTSRWMAGEVVQGQHTFTLPAALESGRYTLRFQLLGADGQPTGEPVSWGEGGQLVVVAPERQTAIPAMQHRLDVNLGDQVTLLGYDLTPAVPQPGETFRLTLYWRAEQEMSPSYKVFVHLFDAEGRLRAQHDAVPADWTRPTTGWLPGEVVTDAHPLTLAADAPPGEYRLQIGLYDPETNLRLPVLDIAGQTIGDQVPLAPISVEP